MSRADILAGTLGELGSGFWNGVPVVPNSQLLDGTVLNFQRRWLIVGTRPWTALEVAGEQGRRIARNGLADVLEWLGEQVGPPVDAPCPPVTGAQLLQLIKDGAV